jgi:hypothetical protein
MSHPIPSRPTFPTVHTFDLSSELNRNSSARNGSSKQSSFSRVRRCSAASTRSSVAASTWERIVRRVAVVWADEAEAAVRVSSYGRSTMSGGEGARWGRAMHHTRDRVGSPALCVGIKGAGRGHVVSYVARARRRPPSLDPAWTLR